MVLTLGGDILFNFFAYMELPIIGTIKIEGTANLSNIIVIAKDNFQGQLDINI